MHCIVTSSKEFQDLLKESGFKPEILKVKISVFQDKNGLDSFPTLKDLGVNPSTVNYALKAVEILAGDKAKHTFEKGEKNNWSLDKILTELNVPKEQKKILLDLGITNREELLTSLLADYSYSVEVNISKESKADRGYEMRDLGDGDFEPTPFEPDVDLEYEEDENGIVHTRIVLTERGKKDFEDKPTQYYSNLTVPGGTNYTENEISTPLITPSIKGHAQFSSDSGIGWTRTDEKVQYTEKDIDSLIDILKNSGQLEINCK